MAKGLRALGRVDEALSIQQALHHVYEVEENPDGYVYEELAECLLLLNQKNEAASYFRLAYDLLSQDEWLMKHEADRLARLRSLSRD